MLTPEPESGKQAECPHKRPYTGWANDEHGQPKMWVACCDCGEVITLDYFGTLPKNIQKNWQTLRQRAEAAAALAALCTAEA